MILLDSDHLTVLRYPENPTHAVLQQRLREAVDSDVATSIINVEEQMRGWLAFINKLKDVDAQIPAYLRLQKMFSFFEKWRIIPFDPRAAAEFKELRGQKVRIGTQDLKIAAIALVNDALLLSANLRDFQKVPELRVENWLQ